MEVVSRFGQQGRSAGVVSLGSQQGIQLNRKELFIQCSEYRFLAIDAREYFVLQLCPSGPTASSAIGARDDMSRLWRSPGPIVTPRRVNGRSTD